MIDDDFLGSRLRERLMIKPERKVLIAKLNGSIEAKDSYTLINCAGFGRVRHFRNYLLYLERHVFPERPLRPNYRGYPPKADIRSQVFQIAGCNWRCWYCFVDDNRLSANPRFGAYLSAESLIDLYMNEPERPDIIDLSGGQPDLVPEWTLWVVDECQRRGILNDIYLWIDDNLSNDFLVRFLSSYEINRLAAIPKLSRMGCFKGFDEESFAFTTGVEPSKFGKQFEVARSILAAGFRFYSYATFASPTNSALELKICQFIDKLQSVHEAMPLWTTPLKIHAFSVPQMRLNNARTTALESQVTVFQAWDSELRRRFSASDLALRPDQVQ